MPYEYKKKLYEDYIRKINKVRKHIRSNISGNISLVILSEISGLSIFHFWRIFTTLTGETPAAFIKRIRIEEVTNYIINDSNLTITQIVFRCGYSSPQSLSCNFKDYFRIIPNNYMALNPHVPAKII